MKYKNKCLRFISHDLLKSKQRILSHIWVLVNKQFHEIHLNTSLLEHDLSSRMISNKLAKVMRRNRECKRVLPRPNDLTELPKDFPVLILKVSNILLPELLRQVHWRPQKDPRHDLRAVHIPRAHLQNFLAEPVSNDSEIILDLRVTPL